MCQSRNRLGSEAKEGRSRAEILASAVTYGEVLLAFLRRLGCRSKFALRACANGVVQPRPDNA
jgi:hypothetical protein